MKYDLPPGTRVTHNNQSQPEPGKRKPRILIIGHGRHGKDTFAELISVICGLNFKSSSIFVGERCVWPAWGQERYETFEECFADRVNYRKIWGDLISAWNTPDKARTARTMLEEGNDMYVGMRRVDELTACLEDDIFDHIIWVDACGRLEKEPFDSMELEPNMADMFVDNNGPEENLLDAALNLQKMLHDNGYYVGYHEPVFEENTPTTIANIKDLKPAIGDVLILEQDTSMYSKGTKMTVEDIIKLNRPDNHIQWILHTEKGSAGGWDDALFSLVPKEETIQPGLIAEPVELEENRLTWFDAPEGATPVLDHGFIQLKEVMGSDTSIAESARMSYGRGTKKVNNDQGLINYLVQNHHTSPLEMGEIKVHMRLPIFVMRQWVRHRTANLNEYSGRYSEMIRLWYTPENEQIMYQDTVNKQMSKGVLPTEEAEIARSVINHASYESFEAYEDLLARNVSRETARMVLPLNTYTEVVWKMDVSNLLKFLYLRDDPHSQWEIQQYAKEIAKILEENFPMVYAAYLRSRSRVSLNEDQLFALMIGTTDRLGKGEAAVVTDIVEKMKQRAIEESSST